MRIIDADLAKEIAEVSFGDIFLQTAVKLLLDKTPTVDAVKVVHGRWLYDSGSGKYSCSECGENALSFRKDTFGFGEVCEVCLTDYCPNCGAKMDGGRKNEL